MKINALDHINIITDDLSGTARFFVDIFDLDLRDGPEPLKPEYVKWLYDDNNRAIFHINSSDMPKTIKRDTTGPDTGAIHHVALKCSGYEQFIRRLKDHDISYTINNIPSVQVKQIFFLEPNGVLLELNFHAE